MQFETSNIVDPFLTVRAAGYAIWKEKVIMIKNVLGAIEIIIEFT